MRILFFVLAASLFQLTAFADPTPTPTATPVPTPTHPIALEGVKVISGSSINLPNDELQMLDDVVGDAEVVGLGETDHGSSGFVGMASRVSKYLIEEKGFRLLVFENGLVRSRAMTTWLAACADGSEGDMPIEVLYQPIQQDVDWFNYLCAFNKKHHKNPVVYRGNDLWDRTWERQEQMESINAQLKLGFDSLLALTRAHCALHNVTDWSTLSAWFAEIKTNNGINPTDFGPCIDSLTSMGTTIAEMIQNKANKSILYDLYSFDELLGSSMGWQQTFNADYAPNTTITDVWDSRDRNQARNEYDIWKQEGHKKMMIFTHASHAAKELSPSNWWNYGLGAIHSAISFLMQQPELKDHVKVIGFTGY